MREAVIVSTARTPIGRAYKGAFNRTHGATLLGHAIEHDQHRGRADKLICPTLQQRRTRAPSDGPRPRLTEILEHVQEVVVSQQRGDVVKQNGRVGFGMQLDVDLNRRFAGAEQVVRLAGERLLKGVRFAGAGAAED